MSSTIFREKSLKKIASPEQMNDYIRVSSPSVWMVLTAVIVLPMVKQAGFDLVWFGVYLVIHVEMAQITPPVGFNLFVLQNMSGRDTFSVAKAAFPFFILLNIAVIIITTFPEIALVLPRWVFPAG